jgi:hypothetical protein
MNTQATDLVAFVNEKHSLLTFCLLEMFIPLFQTLVMSVGKDWKALQFVLHHK